MIQVYVMSKDPVMLSCSAGFVTEFVPKFYDFSCPCGFFEDFAQFARHVE